MTRTTQTNTFKHIHVIRLPDLFIWQYCYVLLKYIMCLDLYDTNNGYIRRMLWYVTSFHLSIAVTFRIHNDQEKK